MKKALLFSAMLLAAATSFSQVFREGTEIKARWGGYWHRGTILKIKGDKYLVHYTGYGPGYDQWLLAHEMVRFEYKGKAKTPEVKPAPIVANTGNSSDSVISNTVAKQENIKKEPDGQPEPRQRSGIFRRPSKNTTPSTLPGNAGNSTASIKVSTVPAAEPIVREEKTAAVKSQSGNPVPGTAKPGEAAIYRGNSSADNNATVKTVAYEAKPAWNNRSSSKKMITPDYVGDKLYLCYSVRANVLDIATLYLGKGDQIARNPKTSIDRFDLETEKKLNAANAGTYLIDGEKMMIHWGDGRTENWRVAYSSMALYGIDGKMVAVQKAMPLNYSLNGKFDINGLAHYTNTVTIEFSYKGGFVVRNKTIALHAANVEVPPSQRGRYEIRGNTLHLLYDNGEKRAATICLPVINGKKYLVINSNYYLMQ